MTRFSAHREAHRRWGAVAVTTASLRVRAVEVMRCRKCGGAWKLPLTHFEVNQIIEAHKQRCDGPPEEKGLPCWEPPTT